MLRLRSGIRIADAGAYFVDNHDPEQPFFAPVGRRDFERCDNLDFAQVFAFVVAEVVSLRRGICFIDRVCLPVTRGAAGTASISALTQRTSCPGSISTG